MYQEMDRKDVLIVRLRQNIRERDAELVHNTADTRFWRQSGILADEHGAENYAREVDEYYENRRKRHRTSPPPNLPGLQPLQIDVGMTRDP